MVRRLSLCGLSEGFWPCLDMWPFADGSISGLACGMSNYLCAGFGAFIGGCTIWPKMAAYPLYYCNFVFFIDMNGITPLMLYFVYIHYHIVFHN